MRAQSFGRFVTAAVIAVTLACTPTPPRIAVTPATAGADAASVHFLHFNDVYEITPVEGGKSGGLARVAALRRALRDSFPSLITTLGGDFISPSALGTARVGGQRLNGRQMVSVLNAVGLDIAVLGNHEFDLGLDAFLARVSESRFTLLAANVTDSTGQPFAKVVPHIIVKVPVRGESVRVAIFGVVIGANRPSWTRVADPIETARREARALRDSADVIVALTHLSVDDDARLLTEAPEVDVVLGGHEHENYTLRRGPRFAPVLKGDANVRSVQVVSIRPPSAGRRAEVSSRLVPIVDGMAEDSLVAREAARWVDSAFAGFERDGFRPRELVATTPIALDGREAVVRTTRSELTDLIGAAMRREVPDAEISIFNGGSIRIDDVIQAGPITQYDVIRMLPFGGPIVAVRMRGDLLARMLAAGERNSGRGGYLHRTGVDGSSTLGYTVGGAPVDPTRWYRVAISDYLITGNEVGIEFLKRGESALEVVREQRDIRQAVIDEIRARWRADTATAGALRAQAASATHRDLQGFTDSIAVAALQSWSIPGMSVVVTRGADVLIAKGYGLANRETRTAATPRTVYQLGSISKQFTAAAVMRLAEKGMLRLDDAVSRHLPEYRPQGDSVRLRHLLHQTSGIREEFMLPRYGELITDTTRPNEELMALIEREPLGFAPGSRWSYSNSNYALLAAIAERITGKPYERVLADEFFEPLGYTSLHHCSPLPTAGHHARGYVLDGERIMPAPPENMNWIRGDGGLCASAEDLARWARALATGRVVTRASYQRMVTSERLGDGITPDYGFALSLVPLDDRHGRVSHGGRMAGFTGTLSYYPDHDVAIAILTNRSGLWIEAMEQAIARTVLRLPRPAVRDVALTAQERRRYVGTYDVGIHGMNVRIAERDGHLWLEWPPPGPTSRLAYQGDREFAGELEPDAIRVRFGTPDRSGRAQRATILMAGMHWYGRRLP